MPKQLEFFIYIFFLAATDVMRGRLGAHLKFLPPVSPMDIILELLTQYNNKEVLFSQKVTPQKDFVFALCVAECSVLQCEEKTKVELMYEKNLLRPSVTYNMRSTCVWTRKNWTDAVLGS